MLLTEYIRFCRDMCSVAGLPDLSLRESTVRMMPRSNATLTPHPTPLSASMLRRK